MYLWLAKYWWVLPLIPLPVLAAAVALIVPLHARRRGFVSWFVLQFVAVNPIYPLILVAILPNKARMRLRSAYARELDDRLRRAAVPHHPAAATVTESAGDRPPELLAGPSIGDIPTRQ